VVITCTILDMVKTLLKATNERELQALVDVVNQESKKKSLRLN
jgi:hypothetical protein